MPNRDRDKRRSKVTTDSPKTVGQRGHWRPRDFRPNASTRAATGRSPQTRSKRLRYESRCAAPHLRAAVSHWSTPEGETELGSRGMARTNSALPRSNCDRPCQSLFGNPALLESQPKHAPPVRPRRVGPPGGQHRTTVRTSGVPSPGKRNRPREHPLQTNVAARHSPSPRQLTRSETHACQEWSMTDLNPFTNLPSSRCVLPNSHRWPPIQNTSNRSRRRLRRPTHAPPGRLARFSVQQLSAENPPAIAGRDEYRSMNLYSIKCPSACNRNLVGIAA